MPPILDVAIGTIFVFLLFSLVVSALNELILSLFDNRAKFLQMGVNELLSKDPVAPGAPKVRGKIIGVLSWLLRATGLPALWSALFVRCQPNEWTRQLCNHGLVNALSRSAGINFPSYIPTGAFVTALLDLIARGKLSGGGVGAGAAAANIAPMDIASLTAAIKNLPEGGLKESLLSLLSATGQDLTAFKTALEGWFNASMDRVSGWYKRFAQKWMILIGFILAAVVNVDSIHIIQVLSTNPNLAKAVASQAAAYSKAEKPSQAEEEKQKARETEVTAAKKELTEAQSANDQTRQSAAQKRLDAANSSATVEDARAAFQRSVARLGETGIPIGWDSDQLKALDLEGKTITASTLWTDRPRVFPWISQHRGQLILLVAGWALSALAASFGAPFWFDVLGRFVSIRNSGKPPADKDPTQPSDAPSPPALNLSPISTSTPAGTTPHLANTPTLP